MGCSITSRNDVTSTSTLPEKPGVLVTRRHHSRPEHLTSDTRQLFKRNILDSVGCAIAALPGKPFRALREQFEEYRAPGRRIEQDSNHPAEIRTSPSPMC